MSAPHDPALAAVAFVRAMDAGDWAGAAGRVGPSVPAGAMSAARLQGMWSGLVAQLGALADLAPAEVQPDGARTTVDLAAGFARAAVTLRLVLDEGAAVVGFWVTPPKPPPYVPPPYADPSGLEAIDVAFGVEPRLPGQLVRPRGAGPHPVAVLVHGSGPSDRDERVGPNRPFRDLALGLATRGVAVVRYDKRTHLADRSPWADALAGGPVTLDVETLDDAVAALGQARALPGVDPARVVVVGHSLGATFAPEIARRDGAVAGAALLAPGARSPAASALDQVDRLLADARAVGEPTTEYEGVRAQLVALAERRLPAEALVLGAPAAYWYDLEDRRPLDVAAALDVPLLACFGGRDGQVVEADAVRWERALRDRPGATLRRFAALDHLFRRGAGLATPADYTARAAPVDGELVDALAHWILALSPRA